MRDMVRRDSTAWCPECNDSLDTKPIWEDTKGAKYIDHFEYYCLGCEKTFLLTEKPDMVVKDTLKTRRAVRR